MGQVFNKVKSDDPRAAEDDFQLLIETKIFSTWTIIDLRELLKRFQKQIFGYALVEAQFESILSFKPTLSKHIPLDILFQILDNDNDGRIDGLEFLGGLALVCQGSFEEKARFCFELYDFNLNSTLSKKEMVLMMMSSINGLNILTGIGEENELSLEMFEVIAEDAFNQADRDQSGTICFKEFETWTRTNRSIMAGVEVLSRISLEARGGEGGDDDSCTESDDEADCLTWLRDNSVPEGHECTVPVHFDIDAKEEPVHQHSGDWKHQVLEPTNFAVERNSGASGDGPTNNLELFWAHGFPEKRRHSTNNHVRYVSANNTSSVIAYSCGCIGIVFDSSSKKQRFYMGHTVEITHLTVYASAKANGSASGNSNVFVATGDRSGVVHLWNPFTLACVTIIQGMVKAAVHLIAASPQGNRMAVVSSDADSTLTTYDCSTGLMVASAIGLPRGSAVFGIAYNSSGNFLCMVGDKQIKFYGDLNSNKRAIDNVSNGIIGRKGCRQRFLCVAYCGIKESEDAVVGCTSGELYRFHHRKCVQVVQAHGVKESVLCMYYNVAEGILVTGGNDSMVKTWDSHLQPVGETLDLSEDLDNDGVADCNSLDCGVITVHMSNSSNNRILIGTRGCDIFEAIVPATAREKFQLNRCSWSHASGSLSGLAIHPKRDEFATVGDDKTLRVWSLRSQEQVGIREMPSSSCTVTYNSNGDNLCVGLVDGTVALLDSSSLFVYSSWRHCCMAILDIKFSNDGQFLVVACEDGNIYIYQGISGVEESGNNPGRQKYIRLSICRTDASSMGTASPVTHIDVSLNGKYIRSNSTVTNANLVREMASEGHRNPDTFVKDTLAYWDISTGSYITSLSALRDIVWATNTCVLSWALQGTWPDEGQGCARVTCCDVCLDSENLIVGNTSNQLLVYKYPSLSGSKVFQLYKGHASCVTQAKFSRDKKYVITLGGYDRSIFIWKNESELAEDSDLEGDDDENVPTIPPVFCVTDQKMKVGEEEKEEVEEGGTDGPALALAKTTDAPPPLARGDEFAAVKPWKGAIVEPTNWTPAIGSTDVDLELAWVHGIRSHDCRNTLNYNVAGHIVYFAAAVAIVLNKSTGKQIFLQGAHTDDILSIAAHPSGQLFATGEIGKKPKIIVWSSQDMSISTSLVGHHSHGVSVLSFNDSGNLLASVGMDSNNTLVLYNWQKCVQVLQTPVHKGKIYGMCFMLLPNGSSSTSTSSSMIDVVVSVGDNHHIKFWWAVGHNIKSQRALWGDIPARGEHILCVCSASPGICVTGSASGRICIWDTFRCVRNVSMNPFQPAITTKGSKTKLSESWGPHGKSPIQAMCCIKGDIPLFDASKYARSADECADDAGDLPPTTATYITGDKKGTIVFWEMCHNDGNELELICLKVLELEQLVTVCPQSHSIRSLCWRDGVLVIGTLAAEILEVRWDSIPNGFGRFHVDNKFTEAIAAPADGIASKGVEDGRAGELLPCDANKLESGHFRGEVHGLCCHPFLPVFFTAGDDRTVRCWSLSDHRMLSYTRLPEKCRALDILPNTGLDLSIALNSGAVWVLKTNDTFLNPRKLVQHVIDPNLCGEWTEIFLSDTAEKSTKSKSAKARVAAQLLEKSASQWIQVVRYCLDGSMLAVGSHDRKIYLYSITDCKYKLAFSCIGHTSYICHIDFGVLLPPVSTVEDDKGTTVTSHHYDPGTNSVITVAKSRPPGKSANNGTVREESRSLTADDICLQSTCGAYELLFWRGKDGKRIKSASLVKDVQWFTLSCTLGWPVQGIWPANANGSDINAVARSHSWGKVPVLATADDFGCVKLFNYPCIDVGAPDKCYRGHSSHVTNVAFSYDDTYCITVGGDQCIFVWETDILEEIRERHALTSAGLVLHSDGKAGAGLEDGQIEEFVAVEKNPAAPPMLTGGDESMAIKPYKGAIRAPTNWKESATPGVAPEAILELRFVYGYRGWDCRNNVGYISPGNASTFAPHSIAYHIAAVGIIYNTENHTQLFNTEHDDDILCLSINSEGHMVATGEVGPKPKIVLWDTNTGVTIRVIKYHKKGVSHIAFSNSGSLLVSIGMDTDRVVAVHNVATGLVVGTGKAGRGVDVFVLAVGGAGSVGTDGFLTGGKNHVKFWSLPTANASAMELPSKGGLYNKAVKARTIVSAVYLSSDTVVVTGMSDGSLLMWKDRSNTKFVNKAHTGAISAMCTVGGLNGSGAEKKSADVKFITGGGKDGMVHIWNHQLVKIWSCDMSKSEPLSSCPHVSALSCVNGKLTVGTKASEIFEIDINTNAMHLLVQGHFSGSAEVWGLAVKPGAAGGRGQVFATCGDDMTVRVWDGTAHRQLYSALLPNKGRAAAYNPDASHLAISIVGGKLVVLSSDLKDEIANVSIAKEWCQCMSYSLDGLTLAMGSHDSNIYLLDSKSYSVRSVCKKHHSYITALDFSKDSSTLQSTSGDYELLFWSTKNGQQITSATAVKDVQWATWTLPYGFPVQGIFPPQSDGTDINAVDKSPRDNLLVTGDDFRRVKLFQYPCVKEGSHFKENKGHAEHVPNVRFSSDGVYVYSVGGLDKSVMQFEVKITKK